MKKLVKKFVKTVYDSVIRPYLPKKIASLNGVAVRHAALFDVTDVHPDHEEPLINSVRRNVGLGDEVVIVGGGRGVTTVVAARLADNVTVYEAAEEKVEMVKETVRINSVQDSVVIRHGVVGEVHNAWGGIADAERYSPDELPECNLLEMDCEGAEREILSNLEIRPEKIVVETHGCFGSPTEWVRNELQELGYSITNEETESETEDVAILSARFNKN